jgi:hypothetical protein
VNEPAELTAKAITAFSHAAVLGDRMIGKAGAQFVRNECRYIVE